MTGAPDPKPTMRKGNRPRRHVNPAAIGEAKRRYPRCAACGVWARDTGSGHHVLPKDHGGDDAIENIVVLCGSGTSRCHGAHHGSPYVDEETGERRDTEWVNSRVLAHLLSKRPDVIEYFQAKLGTHYAEHLARLYGNRIHLGTVRA